MIGHKWITVDGVRFEVPRIVADKVLELSEQMDEKDLEIQRLRRALDEIVESAEIPGSGHRVRSYAVAFRALQDTA